MRKFNITVNGVAYEVEVEEVSGAAAAARSLSGRAAARGLSALKGGAA